MSVNHQFVEFSDQVKKRYVKAGLGGLSGWRLNPRDGVNTNNRIDFLLVTPESSLEYTPYTEDKNTQIRQVGFSYEDEVLELYSEREVQAFQRMNRLLIENGLLVEYSAEAPEVRQNNAVTEAEMNRIARMKTAAHFNKRISEITSVQVLNSILRIMEELDDVKNGQLKAIRARINELNTR